jgi:hypothetical protein
MIRGSPYAVLQSYEESNEEETMSGNPEQEINEHEELSHKLPTI